MVGGWILRDLERFEDWDLVEVKNRLVGRNHLDTEDRHRLSFFVIRNASVLFIPLGPLLSVRKH